MSRQEQAFDVVISGSGVMGLTLAKRLSEMHLDVAVLEKRSHFAAGSSIRNEGWLHSGTYHAAAIRNETDAMAVAERTRIGYNWVLGNYPGVVEDPGSKSFALLRDPASVEHTTDRWKLLGISHREVSRRELLLSVPNINTAHIEQSFEVADRSINTRVLYARLIEDSIRSGVSFFTDTSIAAFRDSNTAEVVSSSADVTSLKAFVFIHAVGYGLKEMLDRLGAPGRVRYWKSHLMVTPRLAQDNLFFLEPEEAGVMHHVDQFGNQRSIVGTNADALFVDEPNTTVVDSKVDAINAAGARLLANWDPAQEAFPYACVKTDIVNEGNPLPQLTPFIYSPIPSHYIVLPGKMTEAPYVAEVLSGKVLAEAALFVEGRTPLVRELSEGNDSNDISARPCDSISFRSSSLYQPA